MPLLLGAENEWFTMLSDVVNMDLPRFKYSFSNRRSKFQSLNPLFLLREFHEFLTKTVIIRLLL